MEEIILACCSNHLLIFVLPHYRFFHCQSVVTLSVMHQHMTTIPKGSIRNNLQLDKGEKSILLVSTPKKTPRFLIFIHLKLFTVWSVRSLGDNGFLFLALGFYHYIGGVITGLVKIFIICMTKSVLGHNSVLAFFALVSV